MLACLVGAEACPWPGGQRSTHAQALPGRALLQLALSWGARDREREVAGERVCGYVLGRRCLSPRMCLGRHPVPIYRGPVAKMAEVLSN